MWQHFVNLFYPRLCCGCSLPLQPAEPAFCAACRLGIPRSGYFAYPANPVAGMFRGRFVFVHCGAHYIFEKGGMVQKGLHQLKYKGHREAGEYMGNDMAAAMATAGWLKEITHLVPVPLHPRKKALRGYNQSTVLAEAISAVSGIPVCENFLERAVFSESQTRHKKYSRWSSVQNIFKPGKLPVPAGAHVLLIDDVVTTGSTVEACAHILAANPDVKVSLAVAAYAATR